MIQGWKLLLYGVGLFLILFVGLFPAKNAMKFAGLPPALSFTDIEGSIWGFTVEKAYWLGKPLGTVTFSPDILPLLGGNLQGSAEFSSAGTSGKLTVIHADALSLRDMEFQTAVQGGLGQLPLSGAVTVSDARFDFDNAGRCNLVEGTLRTDAFAPFLSALGSPEGEITVPLTCVRGMPTIVIDFETPMAVISARGQLNNSAQIGFEVILRFRDQPAMPDELVVWLGRSGFQQAGDEWRAEVRVSL